MTLSLIRTVGGLSTFDAEYLAAAAAAYFSTGCATPALVWQAGAFADNFAQAYVVVGSNETAACIRAAFQGRPDLTDALATTFGLECNGLDGITVRDGGSGFECLSKACLCWPRACVRHASWRVHHQNQPPD